MSAFTDHENLLGQVGMGQSVSFCIYFSPDRDTVHTMGLLRLTVIAKFAHPFLANFLTHTADKFLDLPFGLARNPLLRVRTSFYVASGEHRTLFHLRGRRITLCMLLQYGTSCNFRYFSWKRDIWGIVPMFSKPRDARLVRLSW